MTATDERNQAAVRNSVALLASRVLIAAMGWVGSIIIARLLTPTDWGQFSFVFGLLGLLSIITDLGVGRIVLARLVADDDREVSLVASSYIALRVVLGLIGYAVAVSYVLLLAYPSAVVRATAVAGVVVVLATPSHALTVLFQSRLRLTVVAVAEALGQLVQLVLTVVVAVLAPVLLIFVLPFVVNELVKIGWKARYVWRGDAGPRPAWKIEVSRWRGLLVDAIPLTVGLAFGTLLSKVDILLLSRWDTFDSVGLYSVGYKFADVLDAVSFAVVTPVLTLLVRAWSGDPGEFRRRCRDSALALALLGAVTVAAFWASADPIVSLLYGSRFAAATFASRLLVLGAAISMLSFLGFTVLIAADRGRLYPLVGALGLALNVGLNAALIPSMSYDGAAIATVATEGVVLVAIWLFAARTISVDRLLPLGQLFGMMLTTAVIIAVGAGVAGSIPWPALTTVSILAVLVAAWALRVPAIRFAPAFLGSRHSSRKASNEHQQ